MTSPDQPDSSVEEICARIRPTDPGLAERAAEHHLGLTKPPGSLGGLERLGGRLCAIGGMVPPPVPSPASVVVFAADHGVHAEGVSPWPQEVTAQMVANFCAGGAAINAIAANSGADVTVVNAGVAGELLPVDPGPAGVGLVDRPIARGTANLRTQAAMSRDDAARSVLLGHRVASELVADGRRCLVPGDMGIANTTASAALIAVAVGADAEAVTGRGTGIDDDTLELKRLVVDEALARSGTDLDGLGRLAELGGFEIGAIAGCCLAGAEAGIPVLIDGVISLAGATVAASLAPTSVDYLIAGHRSSEPAATLALDLLDLEPVLDLGLRLGEGTGGALALPIVRAAALVMAEMATLADLGL